MAITPKKVGGKKRKGTSKAKKMAIYRNEGRLETNRLRRSKVERRKYIKLLRKRGINFNMDSFTSCRECTRFAFNGEYCVACGYRPAVQATQ